MNVIMNVIISAAISLDGYLDDSSNERLKLSSAEDWRAVEQLRGRCDAILVGAQTVRADNPSLVIKSDELKQERLDCGMDVDIAKVTITASGDLSAEANFFTMGGGRKFVFASCGDDTLPELSEETEIICSEQITARFIVDQLAERGYKTLMVEGGTKTLTMFLTEGVVDELRLAIAPFLVGDSDAPRLVGQGSFKWDKANRMHLVEVEKLGDMAVLHYKFEREKR